MRSSSILDSSKRSAPIVEAILAGNQRLQLDERRLKPSQNTDTNSLFSPGNAFTRTRRKKHAAAAACSSKQGEAVRWPPTHPTDGYVYVTVIV